MSHTVHYSVSNKLQLGYFCLQTRDFHGIQRMRCAENYFTQLFIPIPSANENWARKPLRFILGMKSPPRGMPGGECKGKREASADCVLVKAGTRRMVRPAFSRAKGEQQQALPLFARRQRMRMEEKHEREGRDPGHASPVHQ